MTCSDRVRWIPPSSRTLALLLSALHATFSAPAELRLPALFSDNAVLQQGRSIPVWGWSQPDEEVTVEFRGRTVTTSSPYGRWIAHLPRQGAGGPETLTIRTATQTLVFTNILVGEVWICSGQSNMEWPMSRSENPERAIANSANDQLRLFTVPKLKAEEPVNDLEGRWEQAGPATVERFSAVAYYFGSELQRARGVPVGLIHTSWGGSPAEVWIREDLLAAHPEFKKAILDPQEERERRFDEGMAAWQREAASARAEGRQPATARPRAPWWASELYNGMIFPLIPYAIAGAIWYQGESNASRADQYARLLPTLIQNWRADWGQGDFPFLVVQLAPWDKNRERSIAEITAEPGESDWAELREAQWLATKLLPKLGLVVITDAGDKDDIHPQQKQVVGTRLALAARGIAYRERITYSGPLFRRMTTSRGRARLYFDHVNGGLEARGGPLRGFQICGTDRQWVWAKAEIDGRRVNVSHPDVPEPIAVRYGWSDFPVANLYNAAGLPASPFRTDNFPLTTARDP
jgi:sialate O-acetylesterase